jgi:hypothetical protein
MIGWLHGALRGHKKCWIKNCPIELSTQPKKCSSECLKQGGGLSEVSGKSEESQSCQLLPIELS